MEASSMRKVIIIKFYIYAQGNNATDIHRYAMFYRKKTGTNKTDSCGNVSPKAIEQILYPSLFF